MMLDGWKKFFPDCNERKKCFALEDGKCTILRESYPMGKCPFWKKEGPDPLAADAAQEQGDTLASI